MFAKDVNLQIFHRNYLTPHSSNYDDSMFHDYCCNSSQRIEQVMLSNWGGCINGLGFKRVAKKDFEDILEKAKIQNKGNSKCISPKNFTITFFDGELKVGVTILRSY